MRFYLVLSLFVGAMFGGYRLSETCQQLEHFHAHFLDSNHTSDHTVITAAGVLRE